MKKLYYTIYKNIKQAINFGNYVKDFFYGERGL